MSRPNPTSAYLLGLARALTELLEQENYAAAAAILEAMLRLVTTELGVVTTIPAGAKTGTRFYGDPASWTLKR